MKKKIFPKISKKIKSFLTDESGKITKKDALGLAAGTILLSGIDTVSAGQIPGHHSGFDADTDKATDNSNTSNHNSGGTDKSYHNNLSASYNKNITCSSTQHASGIVNGHYNSNLGGASCTINSNESTSDVSGHGSVHSSHGSHGSHGSHCACGN